MPLSGICAAGYVPPAHQTLWRCNVVRCGHLDQARKARRDKNDLLQPTLEPLLLEALQGRIPQRREKEMKGAG
jgi:hypothetical protein